MKWTGFAPFPIVTARPQEKPETRDETRGRRKTNISCETSSNFDNFQHGIKQVVGMSQSATPDTQNDMTTCLETYEKERFCSFPHRHCEARGKPETRDERRGSSKPSISCETSSNFDILQPQNRRVFLRVFLGTSKFATSNRCFVRGFRQFSAQLTNCHACHGICTLSPLDAALPMRFAKNTQHHTSKVLRLPRKMTLDTSKVLRLPRKLQRIL